LFWAGGHAEAIDLKAHCKVDLKAMSNSAIEIIGGRERRRRWAAEDKLRIVAGTHEPGVDAGRNPQLFAIRSR
jgi:hypothetical protein